MAALAWFAMSSGSGFKVLMWCLQVTPDSILVSLQARRSQTPGERDLEEQRSNDSPELLRPERRASGFPTWRPPRRRSHLSFCHSLSRSESNSSCSNRLLLMASMDGGARNVLFEVAAAGRALKEGPAATWDARPGADAAAPTLETAAVAVWWRVKLEPGCPSSSSNHSSSESRCVLASAMPEV